MNGKQEGLQKRTAAHEVQKTGLVHSNVIQEANTSLSSKKENENDKDNNSVEAENTTFKLFGIWQRLSRSPG